MDNWKKSLQLKRQIIPTDVGHTRATVIYGIYSPTYGWVINYDRHDEPFCAWEQESIAKKEASRKNRRWKNNTGRGGDWRVIPISLPLQESTT